MDAKEGLIYAMAHPWERFLIPELSPGTLSSRSLEHFPSSQATRFGLRRIFPGQAGYQADKKIYKAGL